MDLSVSEMMEMQRTLHALHVNSWAPMEPEYASRFLIYMMEELGEVCGIWKKAGDRAIMEDPAVRAAFLEEMTDVLMYYNDLLLRYHVTPEELAASYRDKHHRNLGRDYTAEYREKYHNG